MNNPRLLILSPTPGRGGAEEYLLDIARTAAQQGWEVSVALELSAATSSIAEELQADSAVSYIDAPLRGDHRWGVPGQAVASARILRRVRPDVGMVVLPLLNLGMGCMIAAALASVPTAVVFQLAPRPVSTGRWQAWCRWALRRRQRWITVSEQNAEAVRRTFAVPLASVTTIYNGGPDPVEIAAQDRSDARLALRTELGLGLKTRVVLTVGRLDAQKGYDDLLEVLPGVLAGRRDVVFAWAGDGDLRSSLESRIRMHGLDSVVRILGHRGDIDRLLDGADLFLLPSRFEGLPFALLEALARGVPALSSDAGGSAEVVRDGVDGLIHRRQDPVDLARQLSWALAHPQEMRAMSVSGRSRAERFSRTRMLQETLTLLADLRDG